MPRRRQNLPFRSYKISLRAADSGWNTVNGAVGDLDGDRDLNVLLGGSVWFENPGNLRAAPGQPWKPRPVSDGVNPRFICCYPRSYEFGFRVFRGSHFISRQLNSYRIWASLTAASKIGSLLHE